MSTAFLSSPVRRFAWKEYRTLRGLWLAVFALALFFDWLFGVVLPAGTDWSVVRVTIGLAAATLYAAGAAGVLFAQEHEEQTYDFLRGLPATWLPVFAGKLLLVTLSALALAGALTLIGLVSGGIHTTTGHDILLAVGVLGVAIFEAIAWGTLCSLLFKRPLVAAIVTLVVGSLAVHLAVNIASSDGVASTVLQSYVTAIPLRLILVVLVLAASVAKARVWLSPTSAEASPAWSRQFPWLVAARDGAGSAVRAIGGRTNRSRTGMIARLVWQAWRESWKLLPLPLVVAACCIGVVVLLNALQFPQGLSPAEWVAFATMFFAPALAGALAFSADQRRGHIRFLAEHAAAPRYVWLSRHLVWLGALLLLAAAITFLIYMFLFNVWYSRTASIQVTQARYYMPPYDAMQEVLQTATVLAAVMKLAGFGLLAAYAIGQFCSMLLRSDVLAAFLALILAVVLSGWVAVLFVWQLSVWWSLFLLAAGLMLATWLRAPAWIGGCNGWQAWVKPALAIAATLWVMSVALPEQRLAQVRFATAPTSTDSVSAAKQAEVDAFLKKQKSEAEATAEMYLKAANMLQAPLVDDPLEPWSHLQTIGMVPEARQGSLGIDETKIPAEQFEKYVAAKEKWAELVDEQHTAAIKLAVEASERPTCQFTFNLDVDRGRSSDGFNRLQLNPGKTYEDIDRLLTQVIVEIDESRHIAVSAPIDRLLAGLRMSAHIRSGQPTQIFIHQLEQERQILGWIGGWAAAKDRTNDERREVLAKLHEIFGSRDESQGIPLMNALYAEQRLIEKVVQGKDLPYVLSQNPVPEGAYLAYLANELPWERERASMALQLITDQNISIARDLANHMQATAPGQLNDNSLRLWLGASRARPAWMTYQPQAATSYLVAFEYKARVPVNDLFRAYCDAITWRRATVIKIALAMFRQDHGEYPESLSELVPEYLDQEPLDPYSGQPFPYHPHGLDLPITRYYPIAREFVEPHTPLFWSVGPNNDRLQRIAKEDWRPGAGNPDDEPEGNTDTRNVVRYVLYNENTWYVPDATNLIFPLPK